MLYCLILHYYTYLCAFTCYYVHIHMCVCVLTRHYVINMINAREELQHIYGKQNFDSNKNKFWMTSADNYCVSILSFSILFRTLFSCNKILQANSVTKPSLGISSINIMISLKIHPIYFPENITIIIINSQTQNAKIYVS